jgi:hypothetical protein
VKPAAPASKSKRISIQVKDFMGEPFGQPLYVTVVSADADKEQTFEMRGGYGAFNPVFNTDSPTFFVKISTHDLLELGVTFPIHFEVSTDEKAMGPLQRQMNIKVTQGSTRKVIQAKSMANLNEKMTAELATEMTASGSSSAKGGVVETAATIAGKIASKFTSETAIGKGTEDMNTYDVLWPLQNWTATNNAPQVLQ